MSATTTTQIASNIQECTKSIGVTLYVDHYGHANPLSTTYLPTASRHLSSSSYRYSYGLQTSPPPHAAVNVKADTTTTTEVAACTSVTEVDAAYCPQCLAFHDPSSASEYKGVCPRAQCRLCPVCACPLSMNMLPADDQGNAYRCTYQCGYCRWSSLECMISSENIAALEVSDESLTGVTDSLVESLRKREADLNGESIDGFQSLLRGWGTKVKKERKNRHIVVSASSFKAQRDVWSIESLEKSLVEKYASLSFINKDNSANLHTEENFSSCDSQSNNLPLRIPFRPKKSRRCRLELQNGRPGILVKSKVNPLEGDSSLRIGHGNWWKKDASAIHVFPNISIVNVGHAVSDTNSGSHRHALLVKIQNPTLGIVRLKFGANGASDGQKQVVDNSVNDGAFMHNIPLDKFQRTYVTAAVLKDKNENTYFDGSTETVELEAAEDAFLELGKDFQSEAPREVKSWDAISVLSSSTRANEIKLIAQQKDAAWFEFIFNNVESAIEQNMESYVATTPIGLQLQVGDGSWETSLIEPIPKEGPDFVLFQVIFVWKIDTH